MAVNYKGAVPPLMQPGMSRQRGAVQANGCPMAIFKKIPLITAVLLAPTAPAFAMSGAGCGGDCASCHSLTQAEASTLLKDLGSVKEVKAAPVRGLWEVVVEREGRSGIVYLDYGKKHLIAGQVFDVATRTPAGEAYPPKKPLERLHPETLSTKNALVMGNPRGKKRLFVFTDPECPFCAKMHVELKKLAAMEPDLAIYIKLFPLKMHPHAYDKARVILGARSLALLEKSFAGGKLPEPGPKDSKKPVDDTMKYAESVGITSTPTLVLPDGRILAGLKDAKAVQQLLQ
jgi:thiol:disulfide interchange protein DsbC